MTGIQVLPPDKSYESQLAQELMAEGQSTGPVYSQMQGIGKIAQALAGAYLQKKVAQNQQDRENATTANLQSAVQQATGADGKLDLTALGKALMGSPQTAGMGLQMLTTAAAKDAKPTNPGYRVLDPKDPKDKSLLDKFPAGSYQQSMDQNSPDYLKISPVGSQSPLNQPAADYTQPLQNPEQEKLAHMLIEGKIDPKSAMFRMIGPNTFSRASYLDPNFSTQDYATQMGARRAFAPGGQYNKNIVALGTAAQHMNLLRQAAAAMQNGDIQALNSIKNTWQTQTGSPLPTTYQALMPTVAAEMAKANGELSLGAMQDIEAPLNKKGSNTQIQDAINGFQGLLSGKVDSLRQQYIGSKLGTADQFNKKFFTPEAQTMFSGQQAVASTQAPQAALDALKANNTPQMQAFFKQKYGYLPP